MNNTGNMNKVIKFKFFNMMKTLSQVVVKI